MNNKDIFFFSIVIGCFVLLGVLIFFMLNETGQCIRNPFIYGASKMKQVECNCVQGDKSGLCPARFFFNDTYLDLTPTVCRTQEEKEYDTSFLNNLNITFSK